MRIQRLRTAVRAHAIDGPYAWFRLAVSVTLATVGSIGMWSVVVVLPVVQAEFDVDRGSASMPFTLTMLGFAIGNAIVGRYVDRFGIVRPFLVSTAMVGSGFFLAAAADTIWQFALVQGVLIGVGTAASFGPIISDISHWFRRRRGIAVAITACGNYIAGVVWPSIIQAIIADADWRTAYAAIGVVCIVTMVPLTLLLRPSWRRHAAGADAGAAAQTTRAPDLSPRALQFLLVTASICCCVAMSMPQVHIVAYCVDLGYGMANGAEMLSLMLAGGVVSRIGSGFLADCVGGVKTLLLGSVLQCAALVFYLPFDGLMSLYVVSLMFGLAQGGIVPSYALIIREYLPAHDAGERVGIVIMASIGGMALGGWLSGWIFDATGSYQAAFLNGIAWNLFHISVVVLLLWRSRGPRALPA